MWRDIRFVTNIKLEKAGTRCCVLPFSMIFEVTRIFIAANKSSTLPTIEASLVVGDEILARQSLLERRISVGEWMRVSVL